VSRWSTRMWSRAIPVTLGRSENTGPFRSCLALIYVVAKFAAARALPRVGHRGQSNIPTRAAAQDPYESARQSACDLTGRGASQGPGAARQWAGVGPCTRRTMVALGHSHQRSLGE